MIKSQNLIRVADKLNRLCSVNLEAYRSTMEPSHIKKAVQCDIGAQMLSRIINND